MSKFQTIGWLLLNLKFNFRSLWLLKPHTLEFCWLLRRCCLWIPRQRYILAATLGEKWNYL